jgi:hypothetical protein
LGAAVVAECGRRYETVALDRAALTSPTTGCRPSPRASSPTSSSTAPATTRRDEAQVIQPMRSLSTPSPCGPWRAATDRSCAGALQRFRLRWHRASPRPKRIRRTRGAYAISKLGEWFAEDAPRAYVLRVESLFGQPPSGPAKGSAAGILATLKAGGSPKVFEDRTISPSYLVDVAQATRSLVESGAPAGLYHCVNSGHCTWLDFAREMARLLGVEPRFTPVRMAGMQLRARRPMFCALSNEKLRSAGVDMPAWQDALQRYLQ